jgi:hypothetical protein
MRTRASTSSVRAAALLSATLLVTACGEEKNPMEPATPDPATILLDRADVAFTVVERVGDPDPVWVSRTVARWRSTT